MSNFQEKLEELTRNERELQFEELMHQWVHDYLPSDTPLSVRVFEYADALVSAMDPLIMRPDNYGNQRTSQMLLLQLNRDIIIRIFYCFNNQVKFSQLVGKNLNAFGSTKEIVSVQGIEEMTCSHVFMRKDGEITGAKIRVSMVAYGVKESKVQLEQTTGHNKWMDCYCDPFSDATSSVEVFKALGVVLDKGRAGDYLEKNSLEVRSFPEVTNEDVKNKFKEIRNHLDKRTSECEGFLREKLGLI
jgi:uncharacterized protein YbcI